MSQNEKLNSECQKLKQDNSSKIKSLVSQDFEQIKLINQENMAKNEELRAHISQLTKVIDGHKKREKDLESQSKNLSEMGNSQV